MRILYGITKSNFGGAQRYVYDLAREAKTAGHDVSVLCGGRGALVDKLELENIRVMSIPQMKRDINLLAEIPLGIEVMKILNKERPDVFHINSSKIGGTGSFAVLLMNLYWKLTSKNFRTKSVFTSHGWAFNTPRPKWQKVLVRIFAWMTIVLAHQTICVSTKTRQDMSSWPFIKNKLVVVYNGLAKFDLLPREEARHTLGVHEDDTFLVGAVAELHRVKGYDVLLEAWYQFKKKNHGLLVIMGDGEEADNLHQLAEELCISSSVIFKGYVDNARALLSGLDVFVMPSRSEAMPYAPLEAGYASRAVVATRVGGIPEIIENGHNGVLVQPESADELLSSLVLLTKNARLRDRLGKELRKTVEEEFSIQKMTEATFKLYK